MTQSGSRAGPRTACDHPHPTPILLAHPVPRTGCAHLPTAGEVDRVRAPDETERVGLTATEDEDDTAFAALDSNGDGVISAAEVAASMAPYPSLSWHKDAAAIHAKMDTDGDGGVTAAELTAFYDEYEEGGDEAPLEEMEDVQTMLGAGASCRSLDGRCAPPKKRKSGLAMRDKAGVKRTALGDKAGVSLHDKSNKTRLQLQAADADGQEDKPLIRLRDPTGRERLGMTATRDEEEEAFEMLDADSDQLISSSELRSFMESRNLGLHSDAFFTMLDSSVDGGVSADELGSFFEAQHEGLAAEMLGKAGMAEVGPIHVAPPRRPSGVSLKDKAGVKRTALGDKAGVSLKDKYDRPRVKLAADDVDSDDCTEDRCGELDPETQPERRPLMRMYDEKKRQRVGLSAADDDDESDTGAEADEANPAKAKKAWLSGLSLKDKHGAVRLALGDKNGLALRGEDSNATLLSMRASGAAGAGLSVFDDSGTSRFAATAGNVSVHDLSGMERLKLTSEGDFTQKDAEGLERFNIDPTGALQILDAGDAAFKIDKFGMVGMDQTGKPTFQVDRTTGSMQMTGSRETVAAINTSATRENYAAKCADYEEAAAIALEEDLRREEEEQAGRRQLGLLRPDWAAQILADDPLGKYNNRMKGCKAQSTIDLISHFRPTYGSLVVRRSPPPAPPARPLRSPPPPSPSPPPPAPKCRPWGAQRRPTCIDAVCHNEAYAEEVRESCVCAACEDRREELGR